MLCDQNLDVLNFNWLYIKELQGFKVLKIFYKNQSVKVL